MTDRELLEAAAKAAGHKYKALDGVSGLRITAPYGGYYWNPLADDGDALRLAVECGLVVDCSRPSAGEPFQEHCAVMTHPDGMHGATRRAIVLAAAEIGKHGTP
jgi:hypothetical protein